MPRKSRSTTSRQRSAKSKLVPCGVGRELYLADILVVLKVSLGRGRQWRTRSRLSPVIHDVMLDRYLTQRPPFEHGTPLWCSSMAHMQKLLLPITEEVLAVIAKRRKRTRKDA